MAKLTKHELRDPDQIWKASRSAFDFLQNQWIAIVVGLGILITGMVGGAYWWVSHQKHEAAASHHYSLAKSYLEQWQLAEAEEKPEALTQLESELEILESDYPRTMGNTMAFLLRAQLFEQQEKLAETQTAYQAYIDRAKATARDVGQYAYGVFLENQGQFEEAVPLYEAIVSEKESPYRKLALLGKGRSLRALNKFEEARTVYQTYLDDYPEGAEVGKVRGLMSLAGVGSN